MKKILLKISGEFFQSGKQVISTAAALKVAREIKSLVDKKMNVAVVVGAGNIMRGGKAKDIDRIFLDYAGMCAALSNGLVLHGALQQLGVASVVDSTLNIAQVGMYHRPERARNDFNAGKVLILGGTGLPYVTTDTAAVIFALELKADLLVKLTKVNGVYDKDPIRYRSARRFTHLDYTQVLDLKLQVMDMSAFAIAQEHRLPIRVCKWQRGCLLKIARREQVGTLISSL